MSLIDYDYRVKERKTILYYNTLLLSELVYLNYEFSNNKYNGITGNDIFNLLNRKIQLTKQEKENIINNATFLIKFKYNKNIIDYEKLEFEED